MTTIRKSLLFLIMIIAPVESFAQVSDVEYYNRLYYLCKVWGHVKYHHTRIAEGDVNWDSVLLASVNGIKSAPDTNAFNDSLMVMLNTAGEMGSKSGSLPFVPDSLNNNNDLTWLQDPVFTGKVKTLLETIRDKFRPQYNTYVGQAFSNGNPTFYNDIKYYSGEAFPDEGKRILSLFRYWNIIHYFYPYKHLMDQSWEISLKEFIPKVVRAKDELSYNLAFREFTTRLCDSHAFFMSQTYNAWNGNAYPPFQVRFIEKQMVITKVLPSVTEINEGDVIKNIDGVDIYKLRDSLRRFSHGSNKVTIENNLNELILLNTPGNFTITLNDGKNDKTITLSRNSKNISDLYANTNPAWQKKSMGRNCSFGIVDMGRLEESFVEQMFKELWSTDALIFDLRNYPLGTLWTIVDYLYRSPIHIANYTVPDITYPGRLSWTETSIGQGRESQYKGKIIILFDERTLSQAEYTCMGLEQFPGSVKIGSTTAAADGNTAPIYLPGGITTYATFLGTYYPDYTGTQRVGIIPDIEILPTIQGIREHMDELMEAAMNCQSENDVFKLYPNPTSDHLHYELSPNNPFKFEIYDIMGRKRISESASSGVIDVSSLKNGIYIFKIFSNNQILTKKIIKY